MAKLAKGGQEILMVWKILALLPVSLIIQFTVICSGGKSAKISSKTLLKTHCNLFLANSWFLASFVWSMVCYGNCASVSCMYWYKLQGKCSVPVIKGTVDLCNWYLIRPKLFIFNQLQINKRRSNSYCASLYPGLWSKCSWSTDRSCCIDNEASFHLVIFLAHCQIIKSNSFNEEKPYFAEA